MSDFKFVCPSCGQRIKTDAAASGRKIDCPGCKTTLIIPAPGEQPGDTPAAKPADQTAQAPAPKPEPAPPASEPAAPTSPAPTPDVKPETKPPPKPAERDAVKQPSGKTAAPPKPAADAAMEAGKTEPEEKSAPASDTTQTGRVQIADLTPAVKRQIVRSARRRISEESSWMPRLTDEGEYAYAAKEENGKLVPVDVASGEATHFSILGAVMLELDERNVTRTAKGRAKFLDHELLDAIRDVAGTEGGDGDADERAMLERGKRVPPVSHAQCLEALDSLAERYSREIEKSGGRGESPEDLRLAELTRRVVRRMPVSVEELCAAVSNELNELNERIADLEGRAGRK